jgi:thymidine phosphorylase
MMNAGAFLMAVYFKSMSVAETTALTRAMMQSGSVLTWPESWITVDKHSTGGVGDKTSLPLAPALAVYGLKVLILNGSLHLCTQATVL